MVKEKSEEFWIKGKKKGEVRKEKIQEKQKINFDGKKVRDSLAQLILTVVELLRELLEKQALRRIEHGSLNEEQIERLGTTFKALKEEVSKLKDYFEMDDEDLNVSLGPLLMREDKKEPEKTSVIEILDRLLGKGVIVKGDVLISVADVDLVSLHLGLLLASIDKAYELLGHDTSTKQLSQEVEKLQKEYRKVHDAENKI
jgi:hypothetical protein